MYEFALCLRSADTIKCERCIGASGHEAARVIRQVAYDDEEAEEAEETTLAPPSLSRSLSGVNAALSVPPFCCVNPDKFQLNKRNLLEYPILYSQDSINVIGRE
jgi:hypothetical protein